MQIANVRYAAFWFGRPCWSYRSSSPRIQERWRFQRNGIHLTISTAQQRHIRLSFTGHQLNLPAAPKATATSASGRRRERRAVDGGARGVAVTAQAKGEIPAARLKHERSATLENGEDGSVDEEGEENFDVQHGLNEDFLMAILCLEEWKDCQMMFDSFNSAMYPATLVALLVQLAAVAKDDHMGRHERIEFRTFLFGVTSRMCRCVASFTPQELSRAAWACGKLTHRDDAFLALVFRKAYRSMEDLSIDQLANLFWGLGKAQHQPSSYLLDSLLRHVARACDADSAEHLGKLVYGLSLMRFQPEPEWLAWMERMTRPVLRCLHPIQVMHMVCSVAGLQHQPHPKWMDVALDVLEGGLNLINVHELAAMVSALAQLMYHPGDGFMEVWYIHTSKVMQDLELHEVLDGMSAIIQLGEDDAIEMYVTALMVVAHEKRASMSAAEHASLLLGISQLTAGWPEDERQNFMHNTSFVLVDLAATTKWKLNDAGREALVKLVSAFASIQHNPGLGWLRKHEAACRAHWQQFTGEEEQVVLDAYSCLGHAWGPVSMHPQ